MVTSAFDDRPFYQASVKTNWLILSPYGIRFAFKIKLDD